LVGADHPGIVHRITTALAQAGLSIDRLETDQEIAPHGGSVLFKMRGIAIALAPLPKHFDIHKIKQDLSELGDSLNCDVVLEDTEDESVQGSFYAG
jgi:glycine cleavage system transcriptional repressor